MLIIDQKVVINLNVYAANNKGLKYIKLQMIEV